MEGRMTTLEKIAISDNEQAEQLLKTMTEHELKIQNKQYAILLMTQLTNNIKIAK
jgi:hypothetical protein